MSSPSDQKARSESPLWGTPLLGEHGQSASAPSSGELERLQGWFPTRDVQVREGSVNHSDEQQNEQAGQEPGPQPNEQPVQQSGNERIQQSPSDRRLFELLKREHPGLVQRPIRPSLPHFTHALYQGPLPSIKTVGPSSSSSESALSNSAQTEVPTETTPSLSVLSPRKTNTGTPNPSGTTPSLSVLSPPVTNAGTPDASGTTPTSSIPSALATTDIETLNPSETTPLVSFPPIQSYNRSRWYYRVYLAILFIGTYVGMLVLVLYYNPRSATATEEVHCNCVIKR